MISDGQSNNLSKYFRASMRVLLRIASNFWYPPQWMTSYHSLVRPSPIYDVVSYPYPLLIKACLHKAYLERVEWGAETDPSDGSKILLQLMKERVFNAIHSTIFNLYKIKVPVREPIT